MGISEGLVNALTGDELLKGRLIDPFVDIDATREALQIACGFSILVLGVGRRGLGLVMQQVFDVYVCMYVCMFYFLIGRLFCDC